MPKESVRAELIRRQAQEGLTLAAFHRGITYVDFARRWENQINDPSDVGAGGELQGVLTRDGNEFAFNPAATSTSRSELTVIRRDGTGRREFPNVADPVAMCWSYDNSHLAMSVQISATQDKPIHMDLIYVDIATKDLHRIGEGGFVTSQCWSSDGKNVVYETNGDIRVYEIEKGESQTLAKGKYPTWSPDGQWVAFLSGQTYYAISSSGKERRPLFKRNKALSGLWWSPDSRIVAFLSQNTTFETPLIMDVEPVRLRVRRLADGSEDWIAQDFLSYLPSYQWITNKSLVVPPESSTNSK